MFGREKKPNIEDLCRFFRILQRFSKAGITPQKCIEHYQKTCKKETLKIIMQSVIKDLLNGANFADAFRKHSFFPSFVTELIVVGEKTGQLSKILDEIVYFLEQDKDMRKKLKSTFKKVGLLISLALFALLIAVFLVIPKVGEIVTGMNTELPFITLVIIGIGAKLQTFWPLFLFGLLLLILLYFYYKKENPQVIDAIKLKIPFIGEILVYELQYKFCKIVALCDAAGGIPINKTLQFTAMAVDNIPLKCVLQNSAKELELYGSNLSKSLEKNDKGKLLKDEIYVMLQAGEVTGEFAKILSDEAEEYRKINNDLCQGVGDKVSATFTVPIMIFVLILVASVYIPLFNMMEVINV